MDLTRRETLAALAAGGAALLTQPRRAAAEGPLPSVAPPPAAPGSHVVAPLPFAPAKLRGLSEKLMVSHHDNNYAAAVKNLNKVEIELAKLPADAAGFVVSGLRQSELTFTNSKILHEAYFGNLGGDGKLSGPIEKRLGQQAGGVAKWEEQFRQLGASLGGGSGWAILALRLHDGALASYWSGNHTQAPAACLPLLVLDMYEHAYQMDYGAQAAKYVDAFFQNISWDEVNRRLERAERAAAALR